MSKTVLRLRTKVGGHASPPRRLAPYLFSYAEFVSLSLRNSRCSLSVMISRICLSLCKLPVQKSISSLCCGKMALTSGRGHTRYLSRTFRNAILMFSCSLISLGFDNTVGHQPYKLLTHHSGDTNRPPGSRWTGERKSCRNAGISAKRQHGHEGGPEVKSESLCSHRPSQFASLPDRLPLLDKRLDALMNILTLQQLQI